MTIKQLKIKYKNEWILVDVIEEDKLRGPIKVKLVVHSKDREDVYNALSKIKPGAHAATFYTGKIPTKGYAVAFSIYVQ